jgi:hypothetical protein
MKRNYFFILSFFMALAAGAQHSLTQSNHAPASGDAFQVFQCDSVDPGPSGQNVLWDFSAITTHSSIVKNYSAQAVTTTTYPAANVALASSVNDVAYLNSSTSLLEYYGGNISVGLVTGSLNYTTPAIYAAYPMTYNTSTNSPVSGTVNIPSLSLNASFTGNSSLLVDGSGTISLPGSVSFSNTLRVVTAQTLNVTSIIATATVVQVNYQYYVDGIKEPVFSVSTATADVSSFAGSSTNTQTFVTRHSNPVVTPPTPTNTVGFMENSANHFSFSLYPNPSSSLVNLATNHPEARSVSVYDITGKLIEKQILTDGKARFDVSAYNNGLYLYTVSAAGSRALKSGKFTVNR